MDAKLTATRLTLEHFRVSTVMAIVTIKPSLYSDLIGKPFVLGGRGPDTFDCYGLVAELSHRLGKTIPDYNRPETIEGVANLYDKYVTAWQPCEAKPGAIAAIRLGRHVQHVAMILPFGELIHTWEKTGGVCKEPVEFWQRRIVGYYEFKE